MRVGHIVSAWRFRRFITGAIRGELKGRIARSKLGFAWFVLQPLAQAAIFAVVLSKVLGARIGGVESESAYAIYLLAGIAVWGLFSEIVNRCLTIFIEYANAMKKIAFPRIALPVIILGSALLTHVLLLAAILVIFLFFGHAPALALLALPVAAFVAAALAFGLGLLLGILNVYARDVGQVMTVVMQLWFWMTPIVYPRAILPEEIQRIVEFNPLTPVAAFYQEVLLYREVPDFSLLLYPAAVALLLMLVSYFVFQRASPELVDAL